MSVLPENPPEKESLKGPARPSSLRGTPPPRPPPPPHPGPTPPTLAALFLQHAGCLLRASALAVPSACSAVPCTCSPTPIRSLLRCHLTWKASLTTPQGQTRPGPLSWRRTPGLLPLPCWDVVWALKREGVELPASVGGRGDPVTSQCRPGTDWRLLPAEHRQEGEVGGSCSGSALVSATRILPHFPSQAPLSPGLCPHQRARAPAGPQSPLLTYCTGQRKPRGPGTGSSESSASAGLARRTP